MPCLKDWWLITKALCTVEKYYWHYALDSDPPGTSSRTEQLGLRVLAEQGDTLGLDALLVASCGVESMRKRGLAGDCPVMLVTMWGVPESTLSNLCDLGYLQEPPSGPLPDPGRYYSDLTTLFGHGSSLLFLFFFLSRRRSTGISKARTLGKAQVHFLPTRLDLREYASGSPGACISTPLPPRLHRVPCQASSLFTTPDPPSQHNFLVRRHAPFWPSGI